MAKEIIQGFVPGKLLWCTCAGMWGCSTRRQASAQSNSAETNEDIRTGSLPFDHFGHAGSRVQAYIQVIYANRFAVLPILALTSAVLGSSSARESSPGKL